MTHVLFGGVRVMDTSLRWYLRKMGIKGGEPRSFYGLGPAAMDPCFRRGGGFRNRFLKVGTQP